ncbi:hypothetical protein H6P81_008421 [Aristolochia fimbriata]|uniref:Uncharacterized protein n=1 Tax=Aristolochia fimbriata TaxID=158543 RepID=A0AAV7EL85_ARIFI|nr:hypothetical protein H6P81_008421 [Aristolochia fimbriata]
MKQHYLITLLRHLGLLIFVTTTSFPRVIQCKDCNNVFPWSSSMTYRYEIQTTRKEMREREEFMQQQRYGHLSHADEELWSTLSPRKLLKRVVVKEEAQRFNWVKRYRSMNKKSNINPGGGRGAVYSKTFLKEVSLHDVRLLPNSLQHRAQLTNLKYLLMLDVDNLVWSFRKTAGLPTPGHPYGGWEDPEVELRGHFLGHFLSATAQMWASTQNEEIHKRMTAVLSALDKCQQKIGTGYLSAFPSEFFDRFENLTTVWAPYYTIHKILAGLLDQYTIAGNEQALKIMLWMVDYFTKRVQNVIEKYSIERQYASLNEETGGMNDVLYRLYTITGDHKHLVLAHLFDKPCFLGYLALKVDSISGFHSNTHIPVVIGSQMRYEATGDELYKEMATYFMHIVNASHTYATGGTSSGEFWHDPNRQADTLGSETEESCTTYNMLKISRNLFRWTRKMVYADHYERAITNGVLTIQRGTDPGVMIYMLPLGNGSSKAVSYHKWGTPFDSFWCCYGTAIESFAKLGDSIYFQEEGDHTTASPPGLYIIQYVSSTLKWKAGRLEVTQMVEPVVSWDPYLKVEITFFSPEDLRGTGLQGEDKESTLNLRIPSWTHSDGAKAFINDEDLSIPSSGDVLSITREWTCDDKLTLQFPIRLRTEYLNEERPEFHPLQAILYGPYLLAGLCKEGYVVDDGPLKSKSSLSDWISPLPSSYHSQQLVTLSQDSENGTIVVFTNSSNYRIWMRKLPESGTEDALHATFRLISNINGKDTISDSACRDDVLWKTVMLEPFGYPGMVVVHAGQHYQTTLITSSDDLLRLGFNEEAASFRIVPGLDGRSHTISLMTTRLVLPDNNNNSNNNNNNNHNNHNNHNIGCYVFAADTSFPGEAPPLQVACHESHKKFEEDGDANFRKAASFNLNRGLREYHPISFIAKGKKRDLLLEPLLNLRDEYYTVYFEIQ